MANNFKRVPKMATTEPSVDEVGGGMKRGGRAKKMMNGGAPMAMAAPMAMPARRRAPAMPRGALMMRKEGGHIRNEKAEIKRVEKELKQHEAMKASKAHKGLKNGGAPKAGPDVMGGLAGGLEATRPNSKKTTGGVRSPGYKMGGQALAAKGDAFQTATTLKPPININDKVTTAKQAKSFNTKTGGVKNTTANGGAAGYKRGGGLKKYASGGVASKGMAIAKKYQTTTNTGNPMPTVKGGTKGIKQTIAGYKDGGHVAMSCKNEGGFASMKKMSKC